MANIELDGLNKKIKVDSGDLTLDVPGDIVLDADGGDITFADGGTNLLKITNSSSDVVFQPQVDAKDIVFKQYDGTVVATVEDNATFNVPTGKLAINGTAITSTGAELNILDGVTATTAELNLIDGVTATTDELNILDGVTSTASEINLLDGGTSVGGSITLADADGVIVNDGGTMKTIPASDFKTFAGGAMTYLGGSQGTTATAGINLSQVFSNDYVAYYGFFSAAATTTSNSTPRIIFTDSSDNKLTSDYKYAGYEHTGGSGGAGAYFYHSTTDGFLPMHTSSMGNSTNLPTDIHFWLTDITDSGHKPHITWTSTGFFHGYDFGTTHGGGAYDAEVTPAGLRFEMANGNVREYNFRLWGLKA